MKTPQPILYIVVATASLLALGTSGTICWLTLQGVDVSPAFQATERIFIAASSFMFGMLANTRSAEANQDHVQETSTETIQRKSPVTDEDLK